MNKNIWDLYKKSEGGKSAISLFTINKYENFEEKVKAIYFFVVTTSVKKLKLTAQ